jgi:hypothetical protein
MHLVGAGAQYTQLLSVSPLNALQFYFEMLAEPT